jgi:hypothetical protein
VASFSENFKISPETYWDLVSANGWGEAAQAGHLAHVAFRDGAYVHSFNVWRDRAVAEAWYRERGAPSYEELVPGGWSEAKMAATWIDLHTFVVTTGLGEPMRDFRRRSPGPQEVADGA